MDKFEEFGKRIDEEFASLKRIKNFENFGRRVDDELARVKSFVKEEVAPETEAHRAVFARGFRKARRGGGVDRSAQCRAECAESAIFMTQAAP